MVIVTTTLTVSKRHSEHQDMHVYFFHEGEDIVRNLAWRRDRPVQWYFELLPAILRDAGIAVTEPEAQEPLSLGSWQQQAGCECGCSPGIVLSRPATFDLYVTIASRIEVAEAAAAANTPAGGPPRDVDG